MATMDHTKLTIVSVYGHNDGASAIHAIMQSMAELPGSRGLLLSISRPQDLPSQIEWKPIYPLTYRQYSVFAMHSLYAFIDTEFCLVVQDDGWVIDGSQWKPEYYEYDYIGAATHAAVVGNELRLQGTWIDEPERIMVQNGGFSLRSKRFLEAPNKLGLTHIDSDNIYLWNEDVQLTSILRPVLESCGIRFASEQMSRGFAVEYPVPKLYENFDYSQLVGHHGQSRKLIGPKHIRVTVSQEQVRTFLGEIDFLDHLQSLGYTIEYATTGNSQETTAA